MPFYDHFHSSDTSQVTPLGNWLVARKNRYYLSLLKELSGRDTFSILEIGPGYGDFARLCESVGLAYAAQEANHWMAQELIRRGYAVTEGLAPPIAVDGKFDVVFMDQVFEHMKGRDQAIEMLESCKEHLKDDGILMIVSPDIFAVKEDFYHDYTHNYPTCMPRLRGLFMDYDLAIVHENYRIAFIRGFWITRLIAFLARLLYSIGVFHLLFRRRAYKAKLSLLPSCLIVGRIRTQGSGTKL